MLDKCWYKFTITGVPDATFYTFKIGSRGGPSYSAADMASKNWTVALTL